MDRLLELLARLTDLTDDERAELDALLTDTIAPGEDGRFPDLTDDQVEGYLEATRAVAQTIAESDSPDVELLTRLVETHEAVEVEAQARVDEAETQAATVAELISRVAANDSTEAAPAASTDPDTDGGDDDPDPAAETEVETAPADAEAVTAAAPRRPRAPLGQLRGRQAPRTQTDPADDGDGSIRQVIVAAAGLPNGVASGSEISMESVAEAMHELAKRNRTPVRRGFSKVHVASFRTEYPDDRVLDLQNAAQNYERLSTLTASLVAGRRSSDEGSAEALVAAGGLCAPLLVRYAIDTVGSDYRPVRDALVSTDGSRGGVRLVPPPVLSSVGTNGQPGDTDQPISIWTNDDDEAVDPDDPATWKATGRITCDEPVDFETYAVVAREQVGNHLANTFPEWVRGVLDLTGVAFSRTAESALLAEIASLSTAVTGFTGDLGAAKHFLEEIDAAAWATRNRHRVPQSTPVRVIAPDVLLVQMRTDIAKELPAGSTAERLAVAEATINQFFSARNVVVTWTPDLVVAGAQAAGSLNVLPTTISYGIGLDGLFAFMDGATLDLGFMAGTPLRDNTSNAQNDFHLFMEGWEGVAKFGGPEHLWVTTTLCPNGATVGTIEPEACGS